MSDPLWPTLWTVDHQSLSMEFSRREHRCGLPFLLQGIFLTQGSDPCLLHLLQLLHWQTDSLPLAPPGNNNSGGHGKQEMNLEGDSRWNWGALRVKGSKELHLSEPWWYCPKTGLPSWWEPSQKTAKSKIWRKDSCSEEEHQGSCPKQCLSEQQN